MDTLERFQQNVERWKAFCPEIAPLLYSFSTFDRSEGHQELSEEEAKSWAETLNYSQFQVLYVYGLQNHAPYAVLKEWSLQENHFLVILESDLEAIAQFFKTEAAEELLKNKNIWLFFLDPNHRILDVLAKLFCDLDYAVTTLYDGPEHEKVFAEITAKLAFSHNLHRSIFHENRHHGQTFFSNYFQNVFTLPSASLGNALFGQFEGVPAIICGAGPSLAKNIDVLKTLSDRALIFGGGSSMNALNAGGMLPHLGVGIDPNQEQLTRIIMNTAFEVPFLFRGRMFRNALQLVSGDKLYITGSSGYTIAEYFEKAFGINYEDVEEGCNVITFSLAIALAMKCDPIILVGVDLAYSDNQAYAPGMVSHPLHKKFRTKVESDDLIYRKDINGNVVPTLWKWITESLWFTDFSARNPSLRLINATEGGIGFVNIPNMTLAEVADKFLTKSYAIETRLSGEIQSHKMPSAVTFECVYSLCQELFESLARAEKELDQYAHELFEKLKDNDENELSLEEFKEALHQKIANRLQQEAGYEYLLKGFDLAFDQLKSRDYMRLSMDQTIIPPKSLRHYLIELEIERMQFLQQTAAINNALIQNALLEQTRKNTPVEVPQDALIVFDASDYSYDKDLLRIIDPECDLNVSQEFIPDPVSGAFRLYYPDGSLKLESYYKDAKLHGPSRFYSDQGQLLSESWFLDGRKEGKAKGFSLEGNLVFIQRFKHGLKRGKQEYFYENQIPRMVLTYSDQGELDGDVILYHPNGVMARKLHFTNGKRNGVEHLWDTQGQLTIEAHFNHNLPTGSAKIWYPSGQLAQETVYDEVTGEPTVSSWKEDGTPIGVSSRGHSDYFQDVAKSSKELTENLNTVFKEVTVLAPLLNQLHVAGVDVDGTNGTEPDLQSLAKDLSMIGEAIGNLQKLNTDLIKEAGLEERTQGEAFWKTASLQREVEQKLHEATAMMQGQLDVLRGTLATTIQAIKTKLNKQKK